jgi:hypothetical protein
MSKKKERLSKSSHPRPRSDAVALIRERTDSIYRQARKHPGRTVAIALGAGYLIGGGLASRLTARVIGAGLRLGLRMVSLPLVSQGIVTFGQGLWSRADKD